MFPTIKYLRAVAVIYNSLPVNMKRELAHVWQPYVSNAHAPNSGLRFIPDVCMHLV